MAAISAIDKITVVRFLGVGARVSAVERQYAYRTPGTAPAYMDADTTSVSLVKHPAITPASLDIFEPVGRAGGVTLEFNYDNDDALVTALARRTIEPLRGANNEDIYTTAFVDSADSSMVLSANVSTVLSGGDLIWFGTNVAACGTPTGATVPITMGKLGTTAEDVPYVGRGVLVFTSWQDLVGRRVEISETYPDTVSQAGETLIYRGVVDTVVPDGPKLTIRTQSRLQQMLGDGGRKFYAPPSDNTVSIRRRGDRAWASRTVQFARDTLWGDPTWTYLRFVGPSGKWAVIKVADDGSGLADVRRYVLDDSEPNILQVGQDEEVYPISQWDEVWPELEFIANARAEYAWVSDTKSPSDLLLDILQGADQPWSMVMRLQDDEIDAAAIASKVDLAASSLESIRSAGVPSEFGELFIMPYYPPHDQKLTDIISKEILEPLGLALVPDKTGVATVIDFRQVFVADDTVANADIKTTTVGPTPRSTKTVIRSWSYTAEIEGTKFVETVYSVLAGMLYGGGKEKSYELSLLATEANLRALANRARAMSATYERAVPEGGFFVGTDIDADVGKVLEVTCDSLPGDDGVRGSGSQRFFVTQYGKEPGAAPRVQGVFFGSDFGALWGPAAKVASYSAGTITTQNQVFTDPDESDIDADKFAVGDYIILLDQYGALKTGAKEITAITTNKIDALHTSAVNGDYIVLASYDSTGQDNSWTWLGDASAELGAANDAAKVWT